MFVYVVYKLVALLANLLPRSVGNWAALRVADGHYFLNRRLRRAVRENLAVILGPGARPEYLQYELRWTFRSFGKYLLEFAGAARFGRRFIDRCVSFQGWEHVEAARREGRGVVLVSAHFGNWELGAAALAARGLPALAVVQRHPNRRVDELFARHRARLDFRAVPVGQAAVPILRHLRSGGTVTVLGDRPYGEGGVLLEFFGRPARFPTGPARLALAAGAAFIPGFVLRRFDDSFTIVFEPPLTAAAGAGRRRRLRALTEAYVRILERYVRENPSQWLNFYPAWEAAPAR